MNMLRAIPSAIIRVVTLPFRLLYRAVRALLYKILAAILATARGIKATPRKILHTPVMIYRGLKKLRDKILSIVQYLESETGKWIMIWKFVKAPYSLLRAVGMNPQSALAVLGLAFAGGSTAIAVEALEPPKFSDAIAGDFVGPNDIPVFTDARYQTLRLSISSTPLDSLIISSTSLGTIYGGALSSGATTAIDIGGTPTNRLTIGSLTIERLRCKQFKMFETNVNRLTVTNNLADGLSYSISAGSGLSNRPRAIIMGNHGAAKLEQSAGNYDRLVVTAIHPDAAIGTFILSDTLTRGGLCRVSYADVGELVLDSNIVGDSSGLAVKSMGIEDTTTAQHILMSQNLEMAIAEPIVRTN